MELECEGHALPCHQFRTLVDEERIAAAVIVRTTYDWHGEDLILQDEPAWPVSPGPFDSPQGPHPGDDLWLHEGVDCLLFGHARAPGGTPCESVEVAVKIGTWERRVRVLGERVWEKGWGKRLLPSPPQPFTAVPLGLSSAFGGSYDLHGLPVPYGDNPDGVGFVPDAKAAVGAQLPQLEEIDRPISEWALEMPVVGLGLCPPAFSSRFERGASFTDDGVLSELRPAFFNHAFPEMVAPGAAPGDVVQVTGVDAAGDRRFVVPELPVRVELSFGDTTTVKPLAVDQIGIEPDQNRVFITWRYPFRYTIRPMEPRRLVLRACHEGDS
ncbi:MAG: DUF2169 domain-containing protein [Planctomycetota bacterium]|jgi:hypothetical protein|nr:DUF2169 domain-containing protein [Planctomycetota bacterium]